MHQQTHHAPNHHLGVREAARRLGLAHTTVGRYVRSHPELNHGSQVRPRVDLDELRRHRAANLNPAPRGRKAAKLIAEGDPDSVVLVDGETPPPAAIRSAAPPNYSVSKAAREAVLADRAQIDLDEKRGLLVPISEIQDAVFEAGRTLQRDLLELAGQLAERIAAMDDSREIAALLESELRRVLATMAASLRAKAAAEEEPRAPGQVTSLPESTPARL